MSINLYHGNNIAVLKTFEDNSVDSVVTDPPYGLEFMGKKWDYDVPSVEFWKEVLRVLKPGGHVLSFSGTRTYHRMVVNIEDAGFEIRDQIGWAFGSGFPKGRDIAKDIDKIKGAKREVVGKIKAPGFSFKGVEQGAQNRNVYEWDELDKKPITEEAKKWEGWSTALKPAWEPCVVARKPMGQTVAKNVLEWGTGAFNIEECRIPTEEERPLREVSELREDVDYQGNSLQGRLDGSLKTSKAVGSTSQGRWPANLIHDGSDEVLKLFPDAKGQQGDVSGNEPSEMCKNVYGKGWKRPAQAARIESNQSASRFFYCSKASKKDRAGSKHPTVKPVDLMTYLVKLVTPKGGVVLDPFAGSGTTGQAALDAGCDAILIELEEDYVKDIRQRFLLFIEKDITLPD